jgi:3-oxochol-4-en-24-oyl-CoA dehydrogenase
MNLHLSKQQLMLQDMFGKMFRQESTPARIRAAEPVGFDAALWAQLAASGAPCMRVPESAGGGGVNLLDAAVVAEESGRHLISAPLIESIVATRLLAIAGGQSASQWLQRVENGTSLVTLALRPSTGEPQIVPGGRIADAVIWLQEDTLVLRTNGKRAELTARFLNCLPHARLEALGGEVIVLGQGPKARDAYLAAIEEWKLLTAAALTGAAEQALRLAAAYSLGRHAFGKPIGAFQGVAHPLADSITDVDGARLMLWRAICGIASGSKQAAAGVSFAYWFAVQAATRAVTRAMRVFGGYGVSLEYDVQLYFRRIRGWSLVAGDPVEELQRAGDRLWGNDNTPLPESAEIELDFGWGERATHLAEEARAFFREHLGEELRDFAYHSDDGHHSASFRKLAQARLLYPQWPTAYLGRGCGPTEAAALQEVFHEFDLPILVPVVTDMVGKLLLEFGTQAARDEILPRLADGSAYCSLGYSEPSGGSDVFAAKTRAVRDGEDWILNGQKMFTSQGHLAEYGLLLVRTDPEAAKHAGLTLFIVPLRQAGYESHEVKTIGHERTNVTYYTDMRVPDRYRLGDVNGGTKIMGAALKLEQGVGLYNVLPMRRMLKHGLAWARTSDRNGRALLEDPQVRTRLARVACNVEVADALTRRSIWAGENGVGEKWYGSMSKLFGSEAWLASAGELMELAAPDILECAPNDTGWIELEYRRAVPSTIYGGTSEIHRSIISESALQMPRSRM